MTADAGEVKRLRRMVLLLDLLPEAPKYATSYHLATRLGIGHRMAQRDLLVLADVFRGNVVRNDRASPYGWAWAPGKRSVFIEWSRP